MFQLLLLAFASPITQGKAIKEYMMGTRKRWDLNGTLISTHMLVSHPANLQYALHSNNLTSALFGTAAEQNSPTGDELDAGITDDYRQWNAFYVHHERTCQEYRRICAI